MFSDTQRRWLVLLAVMLAFLPVVIDMTILHIAVPSLTQALGASATEVLWIIDIYPLLMAGLLVPMGHWRTASATGVCCSAGWSSSGSLPCWPPLRRRPPCS